MAISKKITINAENKKKIRFLLLLLVCALILLFWARSFNETAVADNENVSEDKLTAVQEDLVAILSDINNAGEVSALIYWSGDTDKEYAYDVSESQKTSDDGSKDSSNQSQMVLTGGNSAPVLISEKYPEIEGVLVVADGAYSAETREALLKAVETCLNIGADKITIAQRGSKER